MSTLRAGIESIHPPQWTRGRHRTGARWIMWADSLSSSQSWASPCTCARSLCAGHGEPGTVPPLCPQDPADEESLNGLDFHSREPNWCFYNFPARNLRYLEITVACDTHIILLESDSGLSAHSLLNDFMWVRGLVSHQWSFTSCHLL